MDQRELDSRVKQLMKCVANNEPSETAVRMLDELKKDASPTEDQLRATKAGVQIAKLRGNANKEIARRASELVTKWKKLVELEKSNKRLKMGSPAPASATSPLPSKKASPAATKSSSSTTSATYAGDPEKRKFDVDKVDLNRTGSKVRDQCTGLIYNGLAYRSTEPVSSVLAKSVAVEDAAHEHYGGENDAYKKKIRSLFSNLKGKTNKALGLRVMSGDIPPARFVAMTDEDLKSDHQRQMEIELEKENMKKAQVPMAEKSISDSLECGRCKQKKVSYTQAQTRSADEPMTTFCECLHCGNRWKFS